MDETLAYATFKILPLSKSFIIHPDHAFKKQENQIVAIV
ncbi:hypothetical protein EF62_0903 [Enterococcus faecalis 62]|nr:hypothetical protein EF62_0903 [Enterococcus faecalis 62]OSH21060.1 hypothetical protein EFNM313_2632 [Enterococcus faecalis]